jgi:hypothetical protein
MRFSRAMSEQQAFRLVTMYECDAVRASTVGCRLRTDTTCLSYDLPFK